VGAQIDDGAPELERRRPGAGEQRRRRLRSASFRRWRSSARGRPPSDWRGSELNHGGYGGSISRNENDQEKKTEWHQGIMLLSLTRTGTIIPR
jgi:hypothetical protein